ncbi:DNA polymerase III subunit gamma/tau, partial [bacterium]|nr:DNA polymerase III subunit gamma/tau [bacterium]
QALSSAIELGKISHAYLFTGPRGTGKTSTARILAKSLNCQKGVTLVPCDNCPSCFDIANSNPIDVIEIDAASNRSVDDARNILEKVQYVPVNGRYKIYIIDEVHMLTKEAFNALLKTLEEPPEKVIFILATTEIQKVLETIVSRCQRFDFRRISTEDIFNHLKYVCEKEQIDIEEDALRTIAKTSSGGMRDALSLLDQVSVLNKKITVDDINSLLGRLSFETLDELFDKIEDSDIQGALEFIEKIYNAGNEAVQILTNLLGYLKNLLIAKNTGNKELLLELTQLTESQIKTLQKHDLENHQITFLIEKVSNYIKELKTSTNLQLWLEVAIIDIANLTNNTKLLEMQERISRLESGTAQPSASIAVSKPKPEVKLEISKPMVEQPAEPAPAKAVKEAEMVEETKATDVIKVPKAPALVEAVQAMGAVEAVEVAEPKEGVSSEGATAGSWADLLQNISSQPTVSLLNQHCAPIEVSSDKVVIACKEIFVKMVSNDTKKSAIVDGAKKLFGKPVEVIIKGVSTDEIAELEKNNKKVELPKKPIQRKPVEQEIVDEEHEEIEDAHEVIEQKKVELSEKPLPVHSDQVTMVMNLFSGKLID